MKIKLLVLLYLVALTSCSSYSVTSQSLENQFKENQRIARNPYYQKLSLVSYPSNNLERIKCVNKKGKAVWLYPDKNTQLAIVRKSDGKKFKVYFDTVILRNDTLSGLRSRLLGGLRSIPIENIEKIEITAEFASVTAAEN